METNLNIFDKILVNVRRQDSSLNKKVCLGDFLWLYNYSCKSDLFYSVGDVYCDFLKDNFPHYNKRMVTVPVSFQYKDVRTHGIVSDDGENKGSKEWMKAAYGLRAEQKIFDEIQRQFYDKPCLLINGFSEHNLIKVVRNKLQQDKNGIQLSDQVFFKVQFFFFIL